MRFEDSKYFQKLNCKKLTLDSGVFYFTDKYVVAEINEGIIIVGNKSMNCTLNY